MKKYKWQLILAISLVLLSAILYTMHFVIFGDAHHIFIYMVGDLAFVPIEVLMVTVIIHRILSDREKRQLLEKLNMVIGAFFSEVGSELLKLLSELDPGTGRLQQELVAEREPAEQEFRRVER